MFVSNAVALEKMRTGEIAAIVHNGGKPNNLLARFRNDAGFRLLEVSFDKFDDYYVPATLTSDDYPNFLKKGEQVDTIAVPAVLAVFNWPASSDRFRRVSRFIDHFFDKFDSFKAPGYQPLWHDINLSANVPGWTRYWRAEEKLKQMPPLVAPATAPLRRSQPSSSSDAFGAPQSSQAPRTDLLARDIALRGPLGLPLGLQEEKDVVFGRLR